MNPGSGNWTVLTRDRTRGSVINISWSPDSSKIYYDRFEDVPRGIFSIPALGGEERLVLEDAAMPELLPDGSILAGRTNAQGDLQLHRFTPQSGRAEPLNARLSGAILDIFRPFPDGKEVAYLGRPMESNAGGTAGASPPHLYVLDLASGHSRPLAPGMDIHLELGFAQPVAISADGNAVLTSAKAGDVYRVISIPRSGKGPISHVLTLTGPPFFVDSAADGSLYVDQWARPFDVLRFAAAGGIPEHLASSKDTISAPYSPMALNDGRLLLMAKFAGKRRLLVATPGTDGTPFVETDEETSPPLTQLGEREVAFQVGVGNKSMIAIAAVPEGRIVRRLPETEGSDLASLAASPDGKTTYYSREGSVWAIPAAGGSPRKLTKGDSIATDPNGREVIVQRLEKDGVHLFRISVDSGAERPIPLTGGMKLFPFPLSPNAVRADGRILLSAFSVDSWFQSLAVLDPATGKLERLPAPYSGDIFAPGWTKDGRILAAGFPMRSSIWRFQKEKEEN